MKSHSLTILLVSAFFRLLVVSHPVVAQDGVVDPYFQTGWGTNGWVEHVAAQNDGKIVFAGSFTQYNGYSTVGIARIYPNGTVDTSFNPQGTSNFGIKAFAVQPDGKIITPAGGMTRLNSDGSVDPTFKSSEILGTRPEVIVLQPDGKVLVGGTFFGFGGYSVKNLVRLNTDGTVDTTFNIGAGVDNFPQSDGRVLAIAIQPDGRILIGGEFVRVNQTTRYRIARLMPDGSLDTSFNAPPTQSYVSAIGLQSDGKVVCGGLSSYNEAIFRFNVDGTRDTNFSLSTGSFSATLMGTRDTSFSLSPGSDSDGGIGSVLIQPDNKIIYAGRYSPARRLMQDGTPDASFSSELGAQRMALESDGHIVLGGRFGGIFENFRFNRIGRLLPNGSIDRNFGYGIRLIEANNIVPQSDGSIFTVHAFQPREYPKYHPAGLYKYFETGLIDSTFNSGSSTSGADRDVLTSVQQTDGKILIAGYDIKSYNGVPVGEIVRINLDGSVDPSFKLGSGSYGSFAGAETSIHSLALLNDGSIIAGGRFHSFSGHESRDLVRLNPDGSVDPTFKVTGPAANSYLQVGRSLRLQHDGKIIVPAVMEDPQGKPHACVIRLHRDGAFDPSFAINFVSEGVAYSLAIQRDQKILVGGSFTVYGVVPANTIIRLNTDGTRDTSFQATFPEKTDAVHSILVQYDGKILLTRKYYSYSPVIRLNSDGSIDSTFHQDLHTKAELLAFAADGKIVATGMSGESGGFDRIGLTRLLNPSQFSTPILVSGRVLTPVGTGLRGAAVNITDFMGLTRETKTSSLGHFSFEGLPSNRTYTIAVGSRRYRFSPEDRKLLTSADLMFVGLE